MIFYWNSRSYDPHSLSVFDVRGSISSREKREKLHRYWGVVGSAVWCLASIFEIQIKGKRRKLLLLFGSEGVFSFRQHEEPPAAGATWGNQQQPRTRVPTFELFSWSAKLMVELGTLFSFSLLLIELLLLGTAPPTTQPETRDFHFSCPNLLCCVYTMLLLRGGKHSSATFLCDMMKNRNGKKRQPLRTLSLKCV